MMLRAFGWKCDGRGASGFVSVWPKARSPSSAVSATAPKPLAQCSSIWRRVSGAGMKRLQCMRFSLIGGSSETNAAAGAGRQVAVLAQLHLHKWRRRPRCDLPAEGTVQLTAAYASRPDEHPVDRVQ